MFSIFWQSVRSRLAGTLYIGLGLGLISLLFSGLFNDFKDQFGELIDVIPTAMEAVVGDMAQATTPEGWLAVELFPLFVPVSLSILGIVCGANLIGREEESGTLELLLASGNSRVKIICGKFAALLKLLAIPMFVLFLFIIAGGMFDFHPNLSHVFAACIGGWLLGATYGGVSFAVQAASGRRGLAIGVGSLLFGATYFLTIVSKLLSSWKDFEIFSPFYYFNVSDTLIIAPDWSKFAVLALTILVCLVISIFGFMRRDTNV